MSQTDSYFDLQRFLEAQSEGVYEQALKELRAGSKRGHWMWYIFPQIRGLGSSATSKQYDISSLGEAIAYLKDNKLSSRLSECTKAVNGLINRTVYQIFPTPDEFKFRSSMTLFAVASEEIGIANSEYHKALKIYFSGSHDDRTLLIIGRKV
jgi:uncharacterized protein (DUF1810 family)